MYATAVEMELEAAIGGNADAEIGALEAHGVGVDENVVAIAQDAADVMDGELDGVAVSGWGSDQLSARTNLAVASDRADIFLTIIRSVKKPMADCVVAEAVKAARLGEEAVHSAGGSSCIQDVLVNPLLARSSN